MIDILRRLLAGLISLFSLLFGLTAPAQTDTAAVNPAQQAVQDSALGWASALLPASEPAYVSDAAALPAAALTNQYQSYPVVNNLSSGISWPNGQAIPTFATPAEVLQTLDTRYAGFGDDERVTFAALQGLVNKRKPELLIIQDGDEGADTWPNKLGLTMIDRTDKREQLYQEFKLHYHGFVVYSTEKSLHYRNAASTIAAVYGYLPVTAEIRAQIEAQGISFSARNIVDITGWDYTDSDDIYQRIYEDYWPMCTNRLLISADPKTDLDRCRDMAAAVGAAVIFCDTDSDSGKALYEKFMKDMGDNRTKGAVAIGWWASERSGITAATAYGVSSIPGNFFISPTVYAGLDHTIQIPSVPKRAALEDDKTYLAVYLSDGDNIQYVMRAMHNIWGASTHGKTAVNWTIAPGLVDISPGMLNYYYSQASDKECFVSGPSGMGYIMPYNNLHGDEAPAGDYLYNNNRAYADRYTRLTETYLQRSGLRVVTIWDGANDIWRQSYADNCRSLIGATVQQFSGADAPQIQQGNVNNRLHFHRLQIQYAGAEYPNNVKDPIGYRDVLNHAKNAIDNWSESKAQFLSYQFKAWDYNSNDVINLEKALQSSFPCKNIEFVRADHYFSFYAEQNGLPFDLNMLQSTRMTQSGRTTVYDFGRSYSLQRYVVRDPQAMAWQVEVSSNGLTWQSIDAQLLTPAPGKSAGADIDLTPTSARYLRITSLDAASDSIAAEGNIEVYGVK